MKLDELKKEMVDFFRGLDEAQIIEAINEIKLTLHRLSPFSSQPIDCVIWVHAESLRPNEYNPNNLAPPEKKLLQTSLMANGFTQPIVVSHHKDCDYVIIDGFHRNELSKNSDELRERLYGYNPVAILNGECCEKNQRIAATIRHNRARGKHKISAMADIVLELVRLGWDDARISCELGMDADEVLRLKQVSGLTELFSNRDFSQGWTVK